MAVVGERRSACKMIGEILLEQGAITSHQLSNALRWQAATGKRLGEQLVEAGYVSAGQVQSALTVQSRLLSGLAIASAIGIGLALAAPAPAPAATQAGSVDVTVTVPEIRDVEYTGLSLLRFELSAQDIRRGFQVLRDQGDLLWRSNTTSWRVYVFHSAWDNEAGLNLFVKYGADFIPGDPQWCEVGRVPTPWIIGDVQGSGTLSGVDWMVHAPADLQPGVYTTTVTFTVTPE